MNSHAPIYIALYALHLGAAFSQAGDRAANTIILDRNGVENLRINTVPVAPQGFETTIFSIGRIVAPPSSRSVLSSRISGRAVGVNAFIGDTVREGEVLVEVESRQPGDPPPTIALKAPSDGLVIDSHVRLGQPVDPETELLDISDRSVMWATAKIPESAAAEINIGTTARIYIPSLGGDPVVAKLERFGIAADSESGTIEGIFLLSNPDRKLQPGMRAEFSLVTQNRRDVMAVPREALQGDAANPVVFVKDFGIPNAFVRAPVKVGQQNDKYIEIIGGLFPGDEVVTQGSYSLGFAGAGSISLKEALDAAHGHEHNEDGSELTDGQKSERSGTPESSSAKPSYLLQIYAGATTIAALVFGQLYWRSRSKK